MPDCLTHTLIGWITGKITRLNCPSSNWFINTRYRKDKHGLCMV